MRDLQATNYKLTMAIVVAMVATMATPAWAQDEATIADRAEVLSQTPLVVRGTRQAAHVAIPDRAERQTGGLDIGEGVWVHVGSAFDQRDTGHEFDLPDGEGGVADTLELVNDYDQDSYAFNVGADLLGGDAWVAGLTGGYLRSKMDFTQSDTAIDWDGVTAGAYFSYAAGALFVDALLQQSWQRLDMDVPQLDLQPDDTVLSTDAQTQSARLDIGYRIDLDSRRLSLDGLLGVLGMRSDIDDLNVLPRDTLTEGVDGDPVEFGDSSSLRLSLGGRLNYEQPLDGLRLTYSLSGRVWHEYDRDVTTQGTLRAPVGEEDPQPVAVSLRDRFAGSFREVGAGVSLSGDEGRVSGALELSGLFTDGYSRYGVSATYRYQW